MEQPYAPPRANLEQSDDDNTYKPKMWALNGRIGRVQYITYSMLMSWLMLIVAGMVSAVVIPMLKPSSEQVGWFLFFFYLPVFAVTFVYARRRLHDLDRSGWFSLLLLLPIANIFFGLYLLFAPGDDHPNNYGPKPLAGSALFLVVAVILPIFLIGILAAIAIPAYQEYTNRAKERAVQWEKKRAENAAEQLENSPAGEESPIKN